MAKKPPQRAKTPEEFMYRFDVWLPLNDRTGVKVPRRKFADFEAEIYDRFKGLTRTPITGSPVYEGYWEDEDTLTPTKDVNTIYTVLTVRDDASYDFFVENKRRWAKEFGHKKVLITLHSVECL
jgi:hypothetical protein